MYLPSAIVLMTRSEGAALKILVNFFSDSCNPASARFRSLMSRTKEQLSSLLPALT